MIPKNQRGIIIMKVRLNNETGKAGIPGLSPKQKINLFFPGRAIEKMPIINFWDTLIIYLRKGRKNYKLFSFSSESFL